MPREPRTCERCGVSFIPTRLNPDGSTPRFCSKACRFAHLSEQRRKGTGYAKRNSVYLHRIAAAEKLGRPLLSSEIVAFKDGDRRNIDHDNLLIFPTRGEFNTWRSAHG